MLGKRKLKLLCKINIYIYIYVRMRVFFKFYTWYHWVSFFTLIMSDSSLSKTVKLIFKNNFVYSLFSCKMRRFETSFTVFTLIVQVWNCSSEKNVTSFVVLKFTSTNTFSFCYILLHPYRSFWKTKTNHFLAQTTHKNVAEDKQFSNALSDMRAHN